MKVWTRRKALVSSLNTWRTGSIWPDATGCRRPFLAIVEDEQNIRDNISFALKREGYQVETHPDGVSAWDSFQESLPDLVVLDIIMPRMDGLELCRKLRTLSETLPIIFLTSRDEEFDRVLGLELGADDYLCKPFSMRELIARIKVLFRRMALNRQPPEGEEQIHEIGKLTLDLQRYVARWGDEPVSLTVTEFMILRALARHRDPRTTDRFYDLDDDQRRRSAMRRFQEIQPDGRQMGDTRKRDTQPRNCAKSRRSPPRRRVGRQGLEPWTIGLKERFAAWKPLVFRGLAQFGVNRSPAMAGDRPR